MTISSRGSNMHFERLCPPAALGTLVALVLSCGFVACKDSATGGPDDPGDGGIPPGDGDASTTGGDGDGDGNGDGDGDATEVEVPLQTCLDLIGTLPIHVGELAVFDGLFVADLADDGGVEAYSRAATSITSLSTLVPAGQAHGSMMKHDADPPLLLIGDDAGGTDVYTVDGALTGPTPAGFSGSMASDGTHVFTLDGHSVQVRDFSDVGAPVLLGTTPDPVAWVGGLDGIDLFFAHAAIAYIATGNVRGDQVRTAVDARDPSAPMELGTFELGGPLVASRGDRLYVVIDGDVVALDTSSPPALPETGRFSRNGGDVFVDAERVYVGEDEVVRVLDLAASADMPPALYDTPLVPVPEGEDLGQRSHMIAVVDSILYVDVATQSGDVESHELRVLRNTCE